jgi:hypothetical protein
MKPYLSSLATLYRGPANSQEYNNLFSTIYSDLSRLYSLTEGNADEIKTNMDILVIENFALQGKIEELEQKVSDVSMSLADKNGFKYLSKTFTDLKNISFSEIDIEDILEKDRAFIDVINNVVMNPIGSSYSRTRATDLNGETFVNEMLEVEVLEGTEEINQQIIEPEMSVFNMFSSNPSVFWYRGVATTENEIFFTVKIKLFTSATSNNYINNINITPFPDHSMEITSVTYIDLNGAEHIIPTFPANAITSFTRTRFAFDKVEASEIVIYGKQSNYHKEGENKKFMYGFQNIDISYNEYSTKTSNFITEFDISKYGKVFDSISYPVLTESSGSIKNIDEYVENKLYIVYNNGESVSEQDFNSTIVQLDCSKIYILTTINNNNETSPMIKNLSIGFATK